MSDRLRELRAALTEKQAKWAEEYLRNGGNATEAARSAGYRGGDAALGRQGADNRGNPKIDAYVTALREELQGGPTKTLLERVRDRLWLIGSGQSIPQYVRGKVVLMPPRTSDQRGALRTLAQMLGGLNPKVQVELSQSLRGQLEALRGVMPEEHFLSLLKALATIEAQQSDDTIDADVIGELPP